MQFLEYMFSCKKQKNPVESIDALMRFWMLKDSYNVLGEGSADLVLIFRASGISRVLRVTCHTGERISEFAALYLVFSHIRLPTDLLFVPEF